nr:PAS domain S-box protein [uncultured Flavobacterium sp.]
MIGKNTLLELFKISPTPSLLLQIDSPKFTIADVNEAYLDATKSTREDLLGKGIFEAFPDNDYDTTADGVKNLSHSLQTVVQTNKRHKMAIQKYDLPIRGTSKFELKYWEPENIPLMNNNEKLKYIIHCVKDVTEKVTAKKQAKEFEYFFNNTNDFSCIANTEGYFEIVNLSFNNAFGYLQNELEKEPFIDFVHPDDIADTLKVYDKLKSGATIIHFINRYRKKDGSYLFLDWSAAPNPVTGKLYCIARDITERKKAEEEITKANTKFSSIFNFNPVAIAFTRISDSQFIQVNDTFCQTTGYNRESIIGKKAVDLKLIGAAEREKIIAQIIGPGSQTKDVEGTLRKFNGELIEVLYRVEKIEIDSEPCLITALIDITDRKTVQRELRTLNQELEQRVKKRTEEAEKALKENTIILESIGDAFIAVDINWTITYWNRIAERDLSMLKNEILGKNLWDVFSDSIDSESYKKYHQAVATNQVVHFEDYYLALNKWYEISAYPSESGLSIFFKDITERKISEKKIKQSEERFKALMENNFDVISLSDDDLNLIYRSPSATRITGWTDAEMKNENATSKIYSEDREKTKNTIREAIKNPGEPIYCLFRYLHKGEYYIWLEGTVTKLADGNDIKGIIYNCRDVTQRIELEHLLVKANSLARLGSWDIDLVKQTVYWNDITKEIHEAESSFVPDLATGLNFYKEGTDRELIRQKVKEAIELGKPWDEELEIVTAKNNVRWIRTIGETEFIGGKCVKIYGSFQDIDQRKKAEIETERLNERLKLAMLSEQLGLWDWDIKNNKLIWDEEMYRLYNLTPNEFTSVYEGWTSRVHEEDRQRVDNEIQLALENKKDYNPEFRIVWPDLSVHYINASGIIERDNDGNAIRMTGFNWDVTERKEAEEKLIESEKLFRDLFQNMRQGFAYCKGIIENGKVVDYLYIAVNTEYEKIFQVENINGKKISDVFPEAIISDPSYSQVLQEVVLQRKSLKFETYYTPSEKWLSVTFYNAENENFVLLIEDITESKESKELIEKSNERFEYVTKATFDAIWDWDINTNTIYWGEGFEKIFGYNLKELKDDSDTWTKNIHPDDLEKITQSYYNTVKSNAINWIEEYRFKKSNGQYAYIINKGIVIRDTSGRAIRIIGAMQDITQKKQEEQRLKLLESVITNTNDAVVIKEAKPSSELGRKIVYVNESFTHMTGYTSDEIIGRTHKLLQGPNTNEEELVRFYKALDEWQPCEISIIYYNKEGKEYWVNLSLNPVTNSKGEYTHWISIERDITEKKNQEIKIKETTQTLLDTLESIQDGFYTLDSNWNVSYWNKEAERISGRTKEEMIGKNFWELYNGRISEKINKVFHKAKSNNKPIRFEVYLKQSKYWIELNAFPSEMGLTVYFKNITERKHTESKLKKVNRSLENHVKGLAISNQELEQFAYVASHDLQEPLRMITSFLTQIEKKYEDVLDEKGKKYIFFAVDGAKRMRQIILDLLEFSRVGKNENRHEKVDLNTIIEEIILLYRKQIEEKKAKINYEALPILQSCAAPLRQVFQNLISNSLKYSSPDIAPIINISCSNSATSWIFEIKDNGIGINPEYYDKIFIIFQRLHSKEEYSGTGMGLAITKKIIENLRGQIWVKSEEGKGTSFYFTIPKK